MPLYLDTPGLRFDKGYHLDQEEDFPLRPGEKPPQPSPASKQRHSPRHYRMNDRQRHQLNRQIRVEAFCKKQAPDFTGNTPPKAGDAKFTELHSANTVLIPKITGQQATQAGGSYGQATIDQAVERAELLDLLRSTNRTASAIAIDKRDPGLLDRFRMPASHNDAQYAAAGQAFATAIEELSLVTDFTAHGYEGDIVADLRAEAKDLLDAEGDQGGASQTQGAATAALPGLLRQGRDIVKCLDAIIKNRYRNDAATLGAWKIASHVTSSAGGGEEPPAPTPPPVG